MSRLDPAQARLLRTVEPLPGEDIRSIAVRYAAIKRLEVDVLLSAGLGMGKGFLASLLVKMCRANAFAELAGFDVRRLAFEAFGEIEDGFAAFSDFAELGAITPIWRRVAPGILKADPQPYVRAVWQFTCLPCDPGTGERLWRFCPSCRKTLSWLRIRAVHLCQHCGFDMRNCTSSCVSDEVRELVGVACALLRRDPKALRLLPLDIGLAPAREQFAFLLWLAELMPIEKMGMREDPQLRILDALKLNIRNRRSIGDVLVSLIQMHKSQNDNIIIPKSIGFMSNEANYLPDGLVKIAVKSILKEITNEIFDRQYTTIKKPFVPVNR